jgi:hypothetical protein
MIYNTCNKQYLFENINEWLKDTKYMFLFWQK